jgi:hypothetical protein
MANKWRKTMITENDATEVRKLTEAEIGDVAGGSVSVGTWISRAIWQMQNAPANSTLVSCSDDMSTCTWQSN